jgi:hypothetical protein
MRRLNLIEIHEQTWFPSDLREGVTDLLQFILNLTHYHRAASPLLAAALTQTRTSRIVDLCSGAGGPWPTLLQEMRSQGALSLCLTDKFPNIVSFEKVQTSLGSDVGHVAESIDAECVPRELLGFRTLFNSFHHFPGKHAEYVLADAIGKGQGVAIFEVSQRRSVAIAATIFMALGTFLFVPFVRPFRFSLFAWTYLIPLLPFVMWFDGIVSCLRSHSLTELRELASRPSMKSFDWQYGTSRHTSSPLRVTYLIGCPRTQTS